MDDTEVWLLFVEGMRIKVFATEEVANAYVDREYPDSDENDYQVMAHRVIQHLDDV